MVGVVPCFSRLLTQGMGDKTIFCGDGFNDLPALAAADVGISVGATEAVIAAAVSTPQGSVAGQLKQYCRQHLNAEATRFGSILAVAQLNLAVLSWCLVGSSHQP